MRFGGILQNKSVKVIDESVFYFRLSVVVVSIGEENENLGFIFSHQLLN